VRAGRFAEAQHEAESGFAAGVDRVEMAKLVKQSRRAVAGPPWRSPNRFESKHYVVASDMDRDTCVQLSKVLEETATRGTPGMALEWRPALLPLVREVDIRALFAGAVRPRCAPSSNTSCPSARVRSRAE